MGTPALACATEGIKANTTAKRKPNDQIRDFFLFFMDSTLHFILHLKSESETTPPESEFVPQTPLGKKLWEMRQRAIAAGLQLLNEDEIE